MKVYSVSEITREIRGLFDEVFSELWIEGEISNFRPATSGHFYFTLKDSDAQIRAVMFRGSNLRLKFSLENGLKIRGYGKLSVYEARGDYQIILEHIEPQGKGDLQAAFEALKKKLDAEGLFRSERKKTLPFLPRTIGLVTSPTGAVIRDMIHVLTRRFPNIHILLAPVLVQGEGAAPEIARAIHELNEMKDVDLLIVGRGGGSMEDLWAFNEESVARAIANSAIPVISAVGHETDFTIADFVADVRAPTPSAAAEIAVPVQRDLLERVQDQRRRLLRLLDQKLENNRLLLRQWQGYFQDPGRRITENLLRVDHDREQMISVMEHRMEVMSTRLKGRISRLEALNPLAILERGYAIAARVGKTSPLKNSREVSPGEEIEVRLFEGTIITKVLERDAE